MRNLLWYPVFVPHITGDPGPADVDTLNVSSTQSPMPLPTPAFTRAFCATVSPKLGLAIWNDFERRKKLYSQFPKFSLSCISHKTYQKVVANSTNIIFTGTDSEGTLVNCRGGAHIRWQQVRTVVIGTLATSQSNYCKERSTDRNSIFISQL